MQAQREEARRDEMAQAAWELDMANFHSDAVEHVTMDDFFGPGEPVQSVEVGAAVSSLTVQQEEEVVAPVAKDDAEVVASTMTSIPAAGQ